ncbi:uncharacterized protein VP01_5277g1 [Puccinia sorghi]|uniref:Uncharacterized protein n=1 Tax=Puccinia sorghi TaxID=27349 RepID=A0A0L6UKC3_9BASI|nr:uncharacterized protein VP01_5277g1 [Puccinia sorghi]
MVKSQKKAAGANTDSLKNEHDRFEKLHHKFDNREELFNNLIDLAGLEKAQEYINNLYSVFESLKLHDNLEVARTLWNTPWKHFAQGKTSLDVFKEHLNLNDKDHSETIHTLIRCAHFVRFPASDHSNMTNEQILAKLDGSATLAGDPKHNDPEIKWSTEIVQQGFHAPYQRHDLIVAPTLKALAEYAEQWDCSKYKSPYTSIIGPTMTGKTRLLMELARYVPVVYICLRPPQSTGQPPRSGLASEFLPSESNRDMNNYYLCLLAAIFKTVHGFFSRQDKSADWNEALTAWVDYSFQMDNTPKSDFETTVQDTIRGIQEFPKQSSESDRYEKLKECLSQAASDMASVIPPGREEGLKTSGREKGLKTFGREKGHKPPGREKELKVLLAIDEARNLIKPKDKIKNISYFRLLRQALAFVPRHCGFFCVFTDTSSQVANLSPSLDRDPSLRLPNQGHELFAPLYKISTLDLNIPPAPSSWDELLSPGRLYSYGSPFYGLYFKNANKNRERPEIQAITIIATAKLMCQATAPTPQELTDSQCFALLGSVIQTRLSLHSPINSELVSSHAAHCLFIDRSRETIISDYPPHALIFLLLQCNKDSLPLETPEKWRPE